MILVELKTTTEDSAKDGDTIFIFNTKISHIYFSNHWRTYRISMDNGESYILNKQEFLRLLDIGQIKYKTIGDKHEPE